MLIRWAFGIFTSGGGSAGLGTVFRLTPSGLRTTVIDFTGPNGAQPKANFSTDADGNLYGAATDRRR